MKTNQAIFDLKAILERADQIHAGTNCGESKAQEAVARARGYKNMRELYRICRADYKAFNNVLL